MTPQTAGIKTSSQRLNKTFSYLQRKEVLPENAEHTDRSKGQGSLPFILNAVPSSLHIIIHQII